MIVHLTGMVSFFDRDRATVPYRGDVGGRVFSVATIKKKEGSLIAALSEKQVFFSSDYGKTWSAGESALPGSCRHVVLSSVDGELNILLGCQNGLYVRREDASAYERFDGSDGSLKAPIHAILPDTASKGVLVVAAGKGLFRSKGKGYPFVPIREPIPSPHSIFNSTNNPTNMPLRRASAACPDHLFGFSNNELFHSKDAGETWGLLHSFEGRYVTKVLDGTKRVTL